MIKITDIDWDYSESTINDRNLPSELTISDADDKTDDEIIDRLSDIYEFTINSCSIEREN